MFKFFKEMLDSVKEGVAEGKAEAAQEEAERQAASQQVNAALEARLAASSRYENLAVALATIYRETFAPDLKAAQEAQRSAVHLLCIGITAEEVEPWKKLLARDFDVSDGAQARAVIGQLTPEPAAAVSDDDMAVQIARASHLATGAAAVGHIPADEALSLLEPVVTEAVERFSGWEAYGRSFLLGEREAPGSNFLGRKVLSSTVEKLLQDERSPWKTVPWPERDALAELLVSR